MADMDKKKDRKFCLLLYPDAENYNAKKVLRYLQDSYDVAYALHDKDKFSAEDEEENPEHKAGTVKKKHYHVVLRWTGASARYRRGLAQEISQKCKCEFPKEAIEPCKDLDGALLYLTHTGEKEKYQYKVSAVKGNTLVEKYQKLVYLSQEGTPIAEQLQAILDVIEGNEGIVRTADLMAYCIDNHYLEGYRKYTYPIHRILDEHNNFYKRLDNRHNIV